MEKVRCPRCSFVLERTGKQLPLCPKCGFSSKGGSTGKVRSVYGDKTSGGRMAAPISDGGEVRNPFGGQRDHINVGLLTAATLTFYGLYVWNWIVPKELRRLHGQQPRKLRYIIGIFIPPVLFIHLFYELWQVDKWRHQRHLKNLDVVTKFMGYWFLGGLILLIGTGFWVLDIAEGDWDWWFGMVLTIIGIVAAVGLQSWMFAFAQKAINDIWANEEALAK